MGHSIQPSHGGTLALDMLLILGDQCSSRNLFLGWA